MTVAIVAALVDPARPRRDRLVAGTHSHSLGRSSWLRRIRLTTPLPPGGRVINPWLIAASVMLATFMEVLDTSVANVSLPHIAGNLSATTDEATWVLTSYLVANAIILPATNWLGNLFGRKRFLVSCIVLFTVARPFAARPAALVFSSSRASCKARPAARSSRFRRRFCSKVSRPRNAARPWPSSPWAWWSRRSSGPR